MAAAKRADAPSECRPRRERGKRARPDGAPHRAAPLPLRIDRKIPGRRGGRLGRDARKDRREKEDRRRQKRDQRGADPDRPRHELGPSGEQRREREQPHGESDPRAARIGRDKAEREREHGEKKPEAEQAILNREGERESERDQRDQVTAETIRLPERAESASGIGIPGRHEIGTEVLGDTHGGHRYGRKHLEQRDAAEKFLSAQHDSRGEEEPCDGE